MGSGDNMDNLMTLIMSVVRKMTGSDQKMDVSDATNALSTLTGFKINLKGQSYDLDNISGNQLIYAAYAGTDTAHQDTTPNTDSWWIVLNLQATVMQNIVQYQIAVPDNNTVCVYLRRNRNINGDASWTAWTKLGGVISPVLATIGGVRYAA